MMKSIVAFSILFSQSFAFASGCLNDAKVYDVDALAKEHGASVCYVNKLEKKSSADSLADRQYNYFAPKFNEYRRIFSSLDPKDFIKHASFEFMFYREVRHKALSDEDARQVQFRYTQTFDCYKEESNDAFKVERYVKVSGTTGLTGVCLEQVRSAASPPLVRVVSIDNKTLTSGEHELIVKLSHKVDDLTNGVINVLSAEEFYTSEDFELLSDKQTVRLVVDKAVKMDDFGFILNFKVEDDFQDLEVKKK